MDLIVSLCMIDYISLEVFACAKYIRSIATPILMNNFLYNVTNTKQGQQTLVAAVSVSFTVIPFSCDSDDNLFRTELDRTATDVLTESWCCGSPFFYCTLSISNASPS